MTAAHEGVPSSELLHHPTATTVDPGAGLLAELVRTDTIAALRRTLPEALPWSTFLPAGDIDTLVSDLVDTVRASDALGDLAQLALLLAQWKHSADVHADPALFAVLTREPDGDLGPAAPPGAAK